ncbi:MAG: ABC transporter permease subunit [Colwellia sp.]
MKDIFSGNRIAIKSSTKQFFTAMYSRLLMLMILAVIWQTAAWLINSTDFPSLLDVIDSIIYHVNQGDMLTNISITLGRVFISFIIAMILGVVIGVFMGCSDKVNELSDTLLIIVLNIPALVTILLCYIWLGLVESAAITAVVINKIPTVVVMIREGARVVDEDLLAVAKVYKLSPSTTFFKVFLPQIYPYIMASARAGLSLIWKIVLVVELLGRSDGVGFALNTLFQFFDIAGILAYTFAFIAVVLVIEALIFRPLDKLTSRGMNNDNA